MFTLIGQEVDGKKRPTATTVPPGAKIRHLRCRELQDSDYLTYSAYGADGTLYLIYADQGVIKAHLVKFAEGQPCRGDFRRD